MAQDDLSHALTLYEYLGNRSNSIRMSSHSNASRKTTAAAIWSRLDEFNWAGSPAAGWSRHLHADRDKLARGEDQDLSRIRCRRSHPSRTGFTCRTCDDWMQRLGSGTDGDEIVSERGSPRGIAPLLLEVPDRDCAGGDASLEFGMNCRDDIFHGDDIRSSGDDESGWARPFSLPDR